MNLREINIVLTGYGFNFWVYLEFKMNLREITMLGEMIN
jgi:hypothetical protein